ncbi:MAG: hypothetical protein HQM06_16685 [Magnetococcales bacterium]|nr:hypothetical protein [Magnetococcales bacterium]
MNVSPFDTLRVYPFFLGEIVFAYTASISREFQNGHDTGGRFKFVNKQSYFVFDDQSNYQCLMSLLGASANSPWYAWTISPFTELSPGNISWQVPGYDRPAFMPIWEAAQNYPVFGIDPSHPDVLVHADSIPAGSVPLAFLPAFAQAPYTAKEYLEGPDMSFMSRFQNSSVPGIILPKGVQLS